MFNDPEKLKEHLVEQEDTASEVLDNTSEDRFDLSDPIGDKEKNAEDGSIGKTIGGHYLILSSIGTGGMSTVYLARHLLLDKVVAIKVITGARAVDSKALMRFQQEAKAAAALNHPNIATVYEFGQDQDGSPFLVMEYVQGTPLSQIIAEEGKLTYERSVAIMLQLCDALECAHQQSVIHRDIKPANIILTRGTEELEAAKIVDFGIAKILSQDGSNLTQTGEVFGTPNYMSPEQCLGKPVDRRSDIYSLGCVFEEMLTGTPPFVAASPLEILMMHVNATPAARHSPGLNEVILRALEKQPADRFDTAKQMASAIRALDQDKRPRLQSSIPSRRRQTIGLVVGVVVSFVVLCAAIVCFTIAKTEIQKIGICVAVIFYLGSLLNILVSQRLTKR